jgi:hypothetical protein
MLKIFGAKMQIINVVQFGPNMPLERFGHFPFGVDSLES